MSGIALVVMVVGAVSAQWFPDASKLPTSDPGAFTANVSPYAGDRLGEARRLLESAVAEADQLARERQFAQAWEALAPVLEIKEPDQTLAPGALQSRWGTVLDAMADLILAAGPDAVRHWAEHIRGRSSAEAAYAIESRDGVALARVMKLYPFSPGAERAGKVLGALSQEAGDFAVAAWAYERLLAQHRQVPLGSDAAGVAARFALCCERLGWKSRLESMLAGLGGWGELKVIEGKRSRTVRDVFSDTVARTRDELRIASGEEDTGAYLYSRSGLRLPVAPTSFAKEEWAKTLPPPAGRLYREQFIGLYPVEAPPYLPAVHQNSLLVNSGSELLALDVHTGSTAWTVAAHAPSGDAYHLAESDPNLILTASAWRGLAFAALENPLTVSVADPAPQIMGLRPFVPMIRRSLTAVDTMSGRVQWVLGGQYSLNRDQTGLSELERQAALVSFHHAVVWAGTLYAIAAERSNQAEVFLFAIDPESGRPLWRLSLCQGQVENTMFGAAAREPFPGVPMIVDGVMYVVSNLGGVIAVDLPGRALKWVSRHDSMPRPYTRERQNYFRKRTFLNGVPSMGVLADGTKVIVAAPTDSRHVHCLEASSGRELWARDIEGQQQQAREVNDAGPSVLIGVVDQHVYVGHGHRLIQIRLGSGEVQTQVELMSRASDGSAVELPLAGRPALAEGVILWPAGDRIRPGTGYVASVKLEGGPLRRGVVPSVTWSREPGNLFTRGGALFSASGKDYTAGIDPHRRLQQLPLPVLSAHFDLDAMIAGVRAELVRRPDDPEAMLAFATIAGQLVRNGRVQGEEVATVLRRAIEAAQNHRDGVRIAELARRGLFDLALTQAGVALVSGDVTAVERAVAEAEQYATSESQLRDIFLIREAALAGSPEALMILYGKTIESGAQFLLNYGERRLPAYVAARARRAERYERLSNGPAAVADWQALIEWALTNAQGEGVRRDCIVRIATLMRRCGEGVYSTVEGQAASVLAEFGREGALEAAQLRQVLRRFPNSTAALQAGALLIGAAQESFELNVLPELIGRDLELRGPDPGAAQLWVELANAYRRGGLDVAEFVAVGRAATMPGQTRIRDGDQSITIAEWVKQRRASIRTARQQAELPSTRLPIRSDALWVEEYPQDTRVMVPDQPAGFPGMVFCHGSNQDRSLLALDAMSGRQVWRGPEVIGNAQLAAYGSVLLVFDFYTGRALKGGTSEELWQVSPGGFRIWTGVMGGMAIMLMQEQVSSSRQQKFELVAIDCQQGTEAWRTEVDPMNGSWIAVGDHSLYAISNLQSARQLVRVDLANGEISARVDLAKHPASLSPLTVASQGTVALVLQSGEVELRDPMTLEVIATLASGIRSPRNTGMEQNLLILVGHSGDAAAIDVEGKRSQWTIPIPAQPHSILSAEIREGRVVLVMLELSDERSYVVATYNARDGSLLRREVITRYLTSTDAGQATWNVHHERAAFKGGMGVMMTRMVTSRDEAGNVRQLPGAPMAVLVSFKDGTVQKVDAWQPSQSSLYPFGLRAHARGVIIHMSDQMAMHWSVGE